MLAPLLEALASRRGALGRNVDVRGFVEGLLDGDHARATGAFAPAMTNTLNDYIEAQFHGELRFDRDVEAVVLDPAFRATPAGELLLGRPGATASGPSGTPDSRLRSPMCRAMRPMFRAPP